MAESLCGKLIQGQDGACITPTRRYAQRMVLINHSDIDKSTVELLKTDFDSPNPTCEYGVKFALKEGATGYQFSGSESGSVYFGTFDKTISDLGHPQYNHNANMVILGADMDAKCILAALDKSRVVAAYLFSDGTVEIYGMGNGLSTADYTYDVQGGGGGSLIVLSSGDIALENDLPYVYVSQVPGQEEADFDALFANPTT